MEGRLLIDMLIMVMLYCLQVAMYLAAREEPTDPQ
jgi:hypothetical protein